MTTSSTLSSGFNTTNQQKYTIGPINPVANRLLRLAIAIYGGTGAVIESVEGCNLTWTAIDRQGVNADSSLTALYAIGPYASPGHIVVTVSGTGNLTLGHAIEQYNGVHTATPVVQSNKNSAAGASVTVTLAALANAVNPVDVSSMCYNAATVTFNGGYDERTDINDATDGLSLGAANKFPGTTNPDFTYTDVGVGGIAFEIAAAPEIDAHPESQTVISGQQASFAVTATTSGGSLTYQWQVDTGGGFGDIGGATSSTYQPTVTIADNNALYRCNVTDDQGTASTGNALLRVVEKGSIAWTGQ